MIEHIVYFWFRILLFYFWLGLLPKNEICMNGEWNVHKSIFKYMWRHLLCPLCTIIFRKFNNGMLERWMSGQWKVTPLWLKQRYLLATACPNFFFLCFVFPFSSSSWLPHSLSAFGRSSCVADLEEIWTWDLKWEKN